MTQKLTPYKVVKECFAESSKADLLRSKPNGVNSQIGVHITLQKRYGLAYGKMCLESRKYRFVFYIWLFDVFFMYMEF